MTQRTETKKNSNHLWEEKNQQTKSKLPKFPIVAESKELVPQIFSPTDLILEIEKGTLTTLVSN